MSYTYLGIPKIVLFPFLTGVSSGGGGGGGSDGSLATAAPFAATSKNGSRCQLDLNFNVFLTVLKTSVVNPDLKFSRIQIRNYLFRIRKKCKSRKKLIVIFFTCFYCSEKFCGLLFYM